MDELLKWRSEFPILDRSVYLVSHSLGAMPARTQEKLSLYTEQWATRGVRAWAEGWWDMPVTVGNLLGKVIGAPEGTIAMHQNVSVAQSVILSCFDLEAPRNKIVYTGLNFPSVMYVFEAAKRRGARIHEVPSHDGMTIATEDVVNAIDEETLLVPISHVLFKSAYLQDAEAIIAKAHSVGAHVILDTYQSAGTVPLHAEKLNVDFIVGGSVKWLCGGPGAGYLYVRKDLQPKLEPAVTGWMAHAAPFAFEPGAIRYAENITRYLHGSPAVPALFAASAGYEIIQEVGVAAIREKSKRQTQLLLSLGEEAGFPSKSPKDPERRGGTITFDVEHGAAVTAELNRRDFVVDYRPGAGIRISPHFYTKDDELEAVIREIRSILETKAYEAHASGAAF
ncbi:MAG: aminotransferase class V-fold PLP-dependent enzyme [Planctomycetota bacterium]